MNSVERVKHLCKERKIPISRLERDLGYSNGYVGQLKKGVFPADRLSSIAKYFNVSSEYLLNGNESEKPALSRKNERDIEKALQETIGQLDSNDGLMFDGEILDDNTKELLKISLENTIRTAKIAAKKKFTPKSIQNGDD